MEKMLVEDAAVSHTFCDDFCAFGHKYKLTFLKKSHLLNSKDLPQDI